jgi:hypothetical protein
VDPPSFGPPSDGRSFNVFDGGGGDGGGDISISDPEVVPNQNPRRFDDGDDDTDEEDEVGLIDFVGERDVEVQLDPTDVVFDPLADDGGGR